MHRISQEREIAVDVGVDEPGADDLARRVDDLPRGCRPNSPDRRHTIAGDADIGVKPGQPGPIDDAAVADQYVKHGSQVVE
jgi:hypothetical protein